jgi:hypothetical protein
MPFNSLDFAIFLPIVFILYWLLPNQNLKSQSSLRQEWQFAMYVLNKEFGLKRVYQVLK